MELQPVDFSLRAKNQRNVVAEVDTTAATTLRLFFARNEKSTGCNSIHLRHSHARHAGAGVDRAGVAEIDPRLPRRQHELGCKVEWHFRHRLRTDAVFLFTSAWC